MVSIQKATCGLSAHGHVPVQTPIRRSSALQARSGRAVPSGRVNASSGGEKGDGSSKSLLENVLNGLTVAVQNSPLAEGKKRLAKLQAGDYDAKAVQELIEGTIQSNPVVMFSFSTCPFCKNAKKLLDDLDVKYIALELDQRQDGYAIRAELAAKTGRTSMPNIWIGGTGIGGCNDGPGIMTLQKEGKLEGMLKEAGALTA